MGVLGAFERPPGHPALHVAASVFPYSIRLRSKLDTTITEKDRVQ